jgi:hypothetical protein
MRTGQVNRTKWELSSTKRLLPIVGKEARGQDGGKAREGYGSAESRVAHFGQVW